MRKPITNDTDAPMYVGGQLLQPNETRIVDVHEAIPTVDDEQAVDSDPLAELKAIAKGTVASILAGLGALTDAELDDLLSIENANAKPRSTLVQALELARLERLDKQKQREQEEQRERAAAGQQATTGDAGGESTVADQQTTTSGAGGESTVAGQQTTSDDAGGAAGGASAGSDAAA